MTSSAGGFSLVETMVAMGLLLAATAGVFALVNPADGALLVQVESGDLQQRLRVAAEALHADLLNAGAPAHTSADGLAPMLPPQPAVMPFRRGGIRSDPPGTFLPGVITIVSVPSPGIGEARSRTYFLERPAAAPPRLMRYNGLSSEAPLVDHVVGVRFEYFARGDEGLVGLTAADLTDGPWLPDVAAADRFDADLLRVVTVRVRLRVEAAVDALRGPAGLLFTRGGPARPGRWLPDEELEFDASPRNLSLR